MHEIGDESGRVGGRGGFEVAVAFGEDGEVGEGAVAVEFDAGAVCGFVGLAGGKQLGVGEIGGRTC